MPPIKRLPRPSIAKLTAEIAAIQEERDALALQLETARRALAAFGTPDEEPPVEKEMAVCARAIQTARELGQSIDVSRLVEEIRLEAIEQSSKDSARIDTLDQLVSFGTAGFGWERLIDTSFHRAEEGSFPLAR